MHNLGNPSSDQIVVSLHVYSPPHSICNFYDARTGVKTVSTLMAVNGLTPPENTSPENTSPDGKGAEGDERSAKRARMSIANFAPPSEQVNLAKFLTELKPELGEDKDGTRVLQLLKRLALHESEWKQCVRFDSDSYTRTLVALEPSFSVVLICWNGGQGTPIHDHGSGTRSWAKVLEGTMEMRRYKRGGGGGRGLKSKQPAVMDEKHYTQGECLMETEYTGLHKVGNDSESAPAVSLHVYSPPYVHCCYETSGGGTEIIPAVHTATGYAVHTATGAAAGATGGGDGEGAAAAAEVRSLRRPAAPDVPDEVSLSLSDSSAQLKLEMQAFGVIYTDFQSCASFLKSELNPEDVKATSFMMQGFDFHPEEWQQYSNYQSVFGGDAEAAEATRGGIEAAEAARGGSPFAASRAASAASNFAAAGRNQALVSLIICEDSSMEKMMILQWQMEILQDKLTIPSLKNDGLGRPDCTRRQVRNGADKMGCESCRPTRPQLRLEMLGQSPRWPAGRKSLQRRARRWRRRRRRRRWR